MGDCIAGKSKKINGKKHHLYIHGFSSWPHVLTRTDPLLEQRAARVFSDSLRLNKAATLTIHVWNHQSENQSRAHVNSAIWLGFPK